MPLKLWRRPDAIKGNWYVHGTIKVWRDGRQTTERVPRQSTGTSDRGEAEAIRTQIEASYLRSNFENQDAPPKFGDLISEYVLGRHKDSQLRYLDKITHWLGDYELAELNQATIDRIGRLAYPDVKPSTMRRQWHGPIVTVLNYNGRHISLRKPPSSPGTKRFVTPSQADKMILYMATSPKSSPWSAPLVEFLFGAGSRMGETLLLESKDLNMDYGTIYFPPEITKNGKPRTVRLLPRTLAALSRLPNLAEPGTLFRKKGGRAYEVKRGADTRGMRMVALRNAAEAAGVQDFNPHMTRHSVATWRLDQTNDYTAVREAGGWSSIKQLEGYAHVAPGIGKEALEFGWNWTRFCAETVQVEKGGEEKCEETTHYGQQ